MAFQSEEEVVEFIKKHQKTKSWVDVARDNHKVLSALVLGKKFHEVLIKRIEKIESADRAIARIKYSKDIRDLFDRVMQPRNGVFTASGGSVMDDIPKGVNKEKFLEAIKHFKGQKSVRQYLAENFFRLEDTDPNGILFLEYIQDVDIFPTYKSINDIRYYESNGQLLNVLLFEPKTKVVGKTSFVEWRVVDEDMDWRIMQIGTAYTLIEDKTFKHPFGKVPATILSDQQVMGSELRVSPIFPIEELSKDYARDKSIKTIYKFQHGFPRHWRYVQECRTCHGTGKTGVDTCEICTGIGHVQTNDITDVQTIALPIDSEDPIVAPNVEGFVTPDLETWARYNEDLKDAEDLIESTMWGTKRLKEGGNETATGRFIDVQPVMNKLGKFANNVEWVHNKLIDWVENWVNGSPKSNSQFHITYGRRFIIESPDVILESYTTAREKGDNNTILDKLLDEYILSKWQNNPILLAEMQKKREVEPFIHLSSLETFEMFGRDEAYKKVLFVDFWEEADKSKDVKSLNNEFKVYVEANKLVPIAIEPPTE